jgi:hypothetical protein
MVESLISLSVARLSRRWYLRLGGGGLRCLDKVFLLATTSELSKRQGSKTSNFYSSTSNNRNRCFLYSQLNGKNLFDAEYPPIPSIGSVFLALVPALAWWWVREREWAGLQSRLGRLAVSCPSTKAGLSLEVSSFLPLPDVTRRRPDPHADDEHLTGMYFLTRADSNKRPGSNSFLPVFLWPGPETVVRRSALSKNLTSLLYCALSDRDDPLPGGRM